MAYLFPGRHVFGLIVSACGLPFRKSAARLPLPLPSLHFFLSSFHRECIQAAAELSHSPKWSKYFGQLVVCYNCSCHCCRCCCCCCCCSYVVAANYDKQQLSEICAGELPAPAPAPSARSQLQSQPSPGRCLIRSKLFVAPALQGKQTQALSAQTNAATCPMPDAPCPSPHVGVECELRAICKLAPKMVALEFNLKAICN